MRRFNIGVTAALTLGTLDAVVTAIRQYFLKDKGMKIRKIALLACSQMLLTGCSTATMRFVKPGASESDFREACEACKVNLSLLHPLSPPAPLPGLAGITVYTIHAASDITWEDRKNFQHCMESQGWIRSSRRGSFCVKLTGSWKNVALGYPASD